MNVFFIFLIHLGLLLSHKTIAIAAVRADRNVEIEIKQASNEDTFEAEFNASSCRIRGIGPNNTEIFFFQESETPEGEIQFSKDQDTCFARLRISIVEEYLSAVEQLQDANQDEKPQLESIETAFLQEFRMDFLEATKNKVTCTFRLDPRSIILMPAYFLDVQVTTILPPQSRETKFAKYRPDFLVALEGYIPLTCQ